ncbi:MAG: hypothetical protein V3U85_01045 [Hyphomicrobium sp.]
MTNGIQAMIDSAKAGGTAAAGGSASASGQTVQTDSGTPSLDDVIALIGQVGSTAQQIGSVVQTITGQSGETIRTRCILGDDVPLGLPDTDPRAWIGPINLGIRVGTIPDWLDVCSDLGFGASGALFGWQTLKLQTPQAWAQIATSSPGAGVASQGQGFEDMSEEQKRAYIANAAAIGIAAAINKLDAYAPIWGGLTKQQGELGWTNKIGLEDIKRALARLSGRGPAFIAAQTAAAPTAPTNGGLEHCLVGDDYSARQACVRQELAANPALARLYANVMEPWLEVSDPNKRLQVPVGLDGRRYVVLKVGGELKGARLMTALITTAVVGTVIVGGGILAFTKGGKKFVKGLFK